MKFFDKLFKRKTVNSQKDIESQVIATPKFVETLNMVDRPKSKQRGIVMTYKVQVDDKIISKLKKRYIAFDVETTGLSPTGDRIIEVGAVLFEDGEIINTYGTLVNPGVSIPSAATKVNQITNSMIESAPREEIVYAELVSFFGDVLDGQTVICAHNAKFDMNFLSETLMRLGYNGKINYIDTLSLSRRLVKELNNYKQDTVAAYFGIVNEQSHRAVSDAEVCGKILRELLNNKSEEHIQVQSYSEKNELCREEIEVCAFVQDSIMKNGGDTDWLKFAKLSNSYIDISYLYSILKFKIGRKGKYIIVERSTLKELDITIEPCTMSEGGSDYGRVYFDSPFDLESLTNYFFEVYEICRKSALDYFAYNKNREEEAKYSVGKVNALSQVEVEAILLEVEQRRVEKATLGDADGERLKASVFINRTEVTINPIHERVPLSDIRNLNNWDKGFDDGYQFWEQGDEVRKTGNIEAAIQLFDKARYNGYCAPALFESYAMAYHKLKDYDDEIDILDEAIERLNRNHTNIGRLEARRDKAIQGLYKQQEKLKKNSEVKMGLNQVDSNKKVAEGASKKSTGRPILQLSSEMIIIKRYETIAEAVRETGINSKSIRDTAKGIQKHAGGYVWKYEDEK